MKRAVVYARFSTDLQKETSIEDQAALCEQIAARNGYKVIKLYSDRAKSGASMFERDGLLALMKATQDRQFDAVITESLPGSPAIKKIWPEFISGSNSGRSKSSTRTAK